MGDRYTDPTTDVVSLCAFRARRKQESTRPRMYAKAIGDDLVEFQLVVEDGAVWLFDMSGRDASAMAGMLREAFRDARDWSLHVCHICGEKRCRAFHMGQIRHGERNGAGVYGRVARQTTRSWRIESLDGTDVWYSGSWGRLVAYDIATRPDSAT